MKIEKILFHTRFRDLALNALEAVLELKKAGLKEVVLTYVIPREEVAFVPYGGYLKEEAERLEEVARLRLEQWQELISSKGLQSKVRIETGSLNGRILAVAEEEKVDLIVTGRKKRTAFEKVYVGSHVLDVIRRSPLPVMMGKYMVQYEWAGEVLTRVNDHIFDRPLLATDWSQPSQNALELITSFKGLSATVVVVHNIGAKISKGLDVAALKKIEGESNIRLEAYCRRLEAAGLSAESYLSAGKTVAEILQQSREQKATLIVMGRTGKDWFQEYWLGGVSHRVAELSELPVLLVP
ncbi:MAG: universal stress protein [Desulfobacterales bacterium]